MVQLSHQYMTTGKSIALTIQTFVGKVMSLLFSMLSRLDITFLPISKCLLISWLQSPSAVILEPKKIKSVTVSTFSPSACHGVMRPDAMILVFQMLSFKPAFSLSSFTPVSSCPQSFPASESFPMNRLFASGGQSTGASASTSVLPMNIQGSFPLGLTGLISLQSMELSRVFSSPTVQKYQFFGAQLSLESNSHIHT